MQANTPVTAPAVALPTLYQEVIHRTRYARWNSAAQRRENWGETVARYFDFFSEYLYTNHAHVISVGERSRLEKAMLDLDIMPSMRALMTAGPALEAVQMANYNCTYTPIDDLGVFSEIMYILMTGSGVGFSVESRYVSKLPAIPQIEPLSDEIILVGDSREGWCDALYGLLTALAHGVEPRRDLSLVRPKGSRLKTFGGYSSGPEPLAELFDHVVATFRAAQGRQLSTVEVFSIATKIAQVVVVGGVRRSATIALFDKDDTAMLNVKGPDAQMYSVDADGKWSEGPNAHYAMANVSAVFEATPTREDFKTFWAALKDGQRGEPGIFNRDAFVANAVAHGRNVRDENGDLIHFGANPSLRAGTRVLTDTGVYPIEQLQDKSFKVPNLNGVLSEAKCFLSGKNKALYAVQMENGQIYYATAEHEWPVWDDTTETYRKVPTIDLKGGAFLPAATHAALRTGGDGTADDGFTLGWCLGDGWITERPAGTQIGFMVAPQDRDSGIADKIASYLKDRCDWRGHFPDSGEINVNNPKLRALFTQFGFQHKSRGLPTTIWTASEPFRRGFIDGLFSADGYVEYRAVPRIGLTTAHKALALEVQSLLGFYGINAVISGGPLKRPPSFPNGKVYDRSYEIYQLRISSKGDVARFAALFPLTHLAKQSRLAAAPPAPPVARRKVVSVTKTQLMEDVWDISVADETHCFPLDGVITGNCCEIQLQPRQACNLTGVAIRDGDTLEQLKVKVELATILGTWQAAVTNFSYLRPEWKKNIEKEALLGTCLTGFYDHEILSQDTPECARWLRELRDHAIVVNKHYAATLGINAATSVTSVKPAGNSGELYDTASGIHPRRAPYYIRRIRQAEHEPMTAFLAACGFPMEVDSQKAANRVFSFPIKSPAHAVCVPQLNALAQLKHWLLVKKNWATHTVSCTINIGPEEWDEVEDWVYANFDEITGLAFLPTFDAQFAQMPEEPVDEATYNALVAEMPVSVDWELLRFFESDDNTAVSQEFTCVGGACTI